MTDSLKIISSRLLITDVGVDTGVPGSSSEVLSLSERDVFAIRVLVALGKTEVDNEDAVLVVLVSAYQEVVRLDVSMDDALLVHLLNALDLQP